MAVAVVDGPLGLEALHTWNGFAINDAEGGLPRALLTKPIAGLHSLPEAEDNRRSRTARRGEIPDPSFERGKTIVYEGVLQAASRQLLRQYAQEMRAAFRGRSNEGVMTIAPHPDWGTVSWEYSARPLQLDIDDIIGLSPNTRPTPWQATFILGLRLSDPRFYLASDPTTTSPAASAATVAVTNQGESESDRLTVTGQISDTLVTVENLSVSTSNGTARLRFDFTNLISATLFELAVDFSTRTATMTYDTETVDAITYLDSDYSQWWDEFIPALKPGTNQLKVTGLDSWTAEYTSATL